MDLENALKPIEEFINRWGHKRRSKGGFDIMTDKDGINIMSDFYRMQGRKPVISFIAVEPQDE